MRSFKRLLIRSGLCAGALPQQKGNGAGAQLQVPFIHFMIWGCPAALRAACSISRGLLPKGNYRFADLTDSWLLPNAAVPLLTLYRSCASVL